MALDGAAIWDKVATTLFAIHLKTGLSSGGHVKIIAYRTIRVWYHLHAKYEKLSAFLLEYMYDMLFVLQIPLRNASNDNNTY